MADIELDNIGEHRTEQERAEQAERAEEEEEETSFNEKTDADYDNIRTRISSKTSAQSETRVDPNDFDSTDLERQIQDHAVRKAIQRYNAIQALESVTGTRFSVTHGDSSKELIDYVSDIKYSEKGNLIALKFKGEDIKLTKQGGIDKRPKQNREILKVIENAKAEYKVSFDAVADEGAGLPVSDEAAKSVQENVSDSVEDLMWDMYGVISKKDLDGNIEREIRRIPYVDENIDYDNLEDPNQKILYDSKIASLKKDIKHWEDLGKNEQNPTTKLLYDTAKELCVAKKSLMEVKAGKRPESNDAQMMIREEAERNDLTRFERFKKWAKENIIGVSAVAISIAGIITTVVIAGRNAAKKGAKAVGQFGKALANIEKKAAPAIATILNIIAQALTWGAKALEFLSRNLWIVALFLTYLLYDSLKDRYKRR